MLPPLKDEPMFNHLTFWDSPDGWYIYDENTDELAEELEINEWAYIEITEEEENALTSPDQAIDGITMNIDSCGNFLFQGYGKHTNEEFWTSQIPTFKIIENFKNVPEIA
jgi:hypothetical protein